ncbi:MAG: hypothetical protein WD068_03265 [Candidatus Babeliales bacterium]
MKYSVYVVSLLTVSLSYGMQYDPKNIHNNQSNMQELKINPAPLIGDINKKIRSLINNSAPVVLVSYEQVLQNRTQGLAQEQNGQLNVLFQEVKRSSFEKKRSQSVEQKLTKVDYFSFSSEAQGWFGELKENSDDE